MKISKLQGFVWKTTQAWLDGKSWSRDQVMQRAYYYDQSERATDTDNPVNQWEFKANTFLSLVFPRRIGGYYSCKRGKTIITSTWVTKNQNGHHVLLRKTLNEYRSTTYKGHKTFVSNTLIPWNNLKFCAKKSIAMGIISRILLGCPFFGIFLCY